MNQTDRVHVTARKGFFPAVVGEDVHIQDAGGLAFIAKQNLAVSRGAGQWLVAGRDQTIAQGGGAILVSREARVTNGTIGSSLAPVAQVDRASAF